MVVHKDETFLSKFFFSQKSSKLNIRKANEAFPYNKFGRLPYNHIKLWTSCEGGGNRLPQDWECVCESAVGCVKTYIKLFCISTKM